METKAPTVGKKLLAVFLIAVGFFAMADGMFQFGMLSGTNYDLILAFAGAILIMIGCFLGCRRFAASIGFLLLAVGGCLHAGVFDFLLAIACILSVVLHMVLRSGLRNARPVRFHWWIPGTVYGFGYLLIRGVSSIPYFRFGNIVYEIGIGIPPTLMFVYVCWLLWLDYRSRLPSGATVAPRQNASAAPHPSGQNALGSVPSQASQRPSAAAPGVTCPQCGGRIPTTGRYSGTVFCTSCGASVTLGVKAGEINDALREQLAALKRMREDDLITQEEFEAKKRQLLGL